MRESLKVVVKKEKERWQILYFDSKKKREIQSVTLNGIDYGENSIIVLDYLPDGMIFGVVKNVFDVNDETIFQYQPLKPCGFREDYAAHMVDIEGNDYCLIRYNDLASPMVCPMFEIKDVQYVVTRHAL
ncbi:hypothetical protein QAD02_007613 [Eretmocerus hayati]|uniref:Uncharacterized protein n=1 Tax=Eretmocerus hayati TaxID=131215 RepID=A0ACC2N5H9_9HYME|nr:hypothetical protein QAD02_007613 [Eretmocerus hayati]